ncbi:hypothetical protein AB0C34_17505 [Nocardia sp. NPDC049220]|uniref:hypothetical protein n=1 Tax=Nocardia sp. NPDC049220 TaxID=3155273 RepID=UPI003411436D
MSRGLGRTQRRLLAALYIGHVGPWRTWDLDAGYPWFAVTEIGLRDDDYDLYDGDDTTLVERDIKRSRRAVIRRGLDGLVSRGYAEAMMHTVDLFELQLTYGCWDHLPTRQVLMARTTGLGDQYVQRHRHQLLSELAEPVLREALYEGLRGALATYGFVDTDPAPNTATRRRRRRRRTSSGRTPTTPVRAQTPVVATSAPAAQLSKSQVVEVLALEGFPAAAVLTQLRAWHREQQRDLRTKFGDPGPALDEYQFDAEQVEELRAQLTTRD